mgnify:CR=1 FL=1
MNEELKVQFRTPFLEACQNRAASPARVARLDNSDLVPQRTHLDGDPQPNRSRTRHEHPRLGPIGVRQPSVGGFVESLEQS